MDQDTARKAALCFANNPNNVANIVITFENGTTSQGWYASNIRLGDGGPSALLTHHPSFGATRPPRPLPFEQVAHLRVMLSSGENIDFGEKPPGAEVKELLRALSACFQGGRFRDGVNAGRAAIEKARATLSDDDPLLIFALANTGECCRKAGQMSEAKSLLEPAAELARRALPEADLGRAGVLNNLGSYYFDVGRYSDAAELFQEVLKIRQAHPKGGPLAAEAINSIGLCMQHSGNLDGAESAFRQTLLILEGVQQTENPLYARALHDLGVAVGQKSDYVQSQSLLERSLTLRKALLGETHGDTIDTLGSLGTLHFVQNDFDVAERWGRKALELAESTLGSTHPRVAMFLMNIGLCHKLRRTVEAGEVALPLFERAHAIRRQSFGEQHHLTIAAKREIEALLKALG
jgi:tetratricopeptide (TPR) repeat protein